MLRSLWWFLSPFSKQILFGSSYYYYFIIIIINLIITNFIIIITLFQSLSCSTIRLTFGNPISCFQFSKKHLNFSTNRHMYVCTSRLRFPWRLRTSCPYRSLTGPAYHRPQRRHLRLRRLRPAMSDLSSSPQTTPWHPKVAAENCNPALGLKRTTGS